MRPVVIAAIFLLVFKSAQVSAQSQIAGIVKGKSHHPVPDANVSLAGSFDGTSTDTLGHFHFSSSLKGKGVLRFSALGYLPDSIILNIGSAQIKVEIELHTAPKELQEVSISAGIFETSDKKKGAVLNSLDVVTTAGAVADIVAAMQTLPGTGQSFSENGLFVHGGAAAESQFFFDGMKVQNPFGSQLPDIASRSRFSPFLFKGTTFSTGGYSAAYGQALSSALLLESKDLPLKTSTEFSLLSVGLGAAHTQRMPNSSLTAGITYYNLQPIFGLVRQNTRWISAPVQKTANLQYKLKLKKTGLLKFFTQYTTDKVALYTDNLDSGALLRVSNENRSVYVNSSYQQLLSDKWKLSAAVSISQTHENGLIDSNAYRKNDDYRGARVTLTRYLGLKSTLSTGAGFDQNARLESWNMLSRSFFNSQTWGFAEGEFFLSDNVVLRAGLRTEHASYNNSWNLAPRTSMAVKTGESSQISFAYGMFYQNPDESYLIQNRRLHEESAQHYILNYQYVSGQRTFRAEAFYKKYRQLTRYDLNPFAVTYGVVNYTGLQNGGDGYGRGFDIFYRDKNTFKDVDYWISYSYLDTRRKFRDYPLQATPPFASKHTLNVVAKKFISALNTEVSTTYSFATGRTYFNPESKVFLGDRTKDYNNLSLNISYLTKLFKQFTVVHAAIDNLPGFNNVYGYRYSTDGRSREAILPSAKRTFLIGVLVTIGDNTFNH